MTPKFFNSLIFVAALVIAGSQSASATKPLDKFAEFKGNFSGSASFVVTPNVPAAFGTGTISVTGPKSGKSLRLVFSGVVTANGNAASYSNTITVSRNGSYVIGQSVFGILPTGPIAGTAKVARKSITGAGMFAAGGVSSSINFKIRSKTVGKKRTLTVDYVISNGGGVFPFQFVASGRTKK